MKKILIILGYLAFACSDEMKLSPSLLPSMSKFASQSEFDQFVNQFAQLAPEDYNSWQTKQSFSSFRTIMLKAYLELDTISSVNVFNEFLKKYKKIFVVKDSVLVPRIDIPLYQAIANEDGFYETDGFVNKLHGDFVLIAKAESFLRLNGLDVDDVLRKWLEKNEKPEYLSIFQITNTGNKQNPNEKSNATCTTYETASYFYNQSNCRNDREVVIIAKSYITTTMTSIGDTRQPRVLIEITALKRAATFCGWYLYTTNIKRANTSFSVMAWSVADYVATPQRFDIALPGYTVDSYVISWDYPIGSSLLNQYVEAQPFISVHSEATHRGVNGNWAILDCR